jgi:hypothetical protein
MRIEVGLESVKLGLEQVNGIFFLADTQFVVLLAMVCTARPIRTTKRSPIPRYNIDIDSVGMGALRRLAPPNRMTILLGRQVNPENFSQRCGSS